MSAETAKRFIDEGSDLQTFTYVRIGREILAQPDLFAALA
jgi:hypothetical protein